MDLVEAESEENKDRVNIMQEHLKNVQQEQVYTQSRVRLFCHSLFFFNPLLPREKKIKTKNQKKRHNTKHARC